MTKEQAINICNKIIQQNKEIVRQTKLNKDINAMQLTANCDNESLAIEIVLNLLKEKDAVIEQLKKTNDFQSKDIGRAVDYTFELNKEIEKQEKQIDLMAEEISKYDIDEGICRQAQFIDCDGFSVDCKECIKKYFERMTEND